MIAHKLSLLSWVSIAGVTTLVLACSSDASTGAAPSGASTSPEGGGSKEGGSAKTCGNEPGRAGVTTMTIPEPGVPDGGLREAIVHVPESYDGTKPAMLVVNFHGLLEPNTLQEQISHTSEASDARGFIVAYPQGLKIGVGVSWNAGGCCGNNADDVGFVRDLVKELESTYCIDPKRIYATGLSNGAMLSYRLACEAADVFAAVAPVAGANVFSPCTPPRPVPILALHGTGDNIVPFNGGTDGLYHILKFPPVSYSIDLWRSLNGCPGAQAPDDAGAAYTPTDSTPDGGPNPSIFEGSKEVSQKGDSACHAWTGCKDGSEVELCTVVNGGHNWPGGTLPVGKVSTDLDATNTIIDFFEKHPMP